MGSSRSAVYMRCRAADDAELGRDRRGSANSPGDCLSEEGPAIPTVVGKTVPRTIFRSFSTSPIWCRPPPQPQTDASGSITSTMRGRCSGSEPRLAFRGLAGPDLGGSMAFCDKTIPRIV